MNTPLFFITIFQGGDKTTKIYRNLKRTGYLRRFMIFSCLLAINCSAFGQSNLPNVTFNTPEVTAFNRNIETPVSLYTGVPNIDIPIFDIIIKGVTVPIRLNYHAGGIRVDQEATWVGLGWNLSYGGEISRKIRGIADEYQYLNTTPGSYNTVDYFMKLPNLGTTPNAGNQEARFSIINNAKYSRGDLMPDEFYYSVLGYSGRFMYSQPLNKFVLFPKEDIAIKPSSTTNLKRDLYLWNLKLPDGISVDFGREGYTSSNTQAFGPSYARNSWLIKTIRSNYTDSIVYNYENFNYNALKLSDQYCKFDVKEGVSGKTNFSNISITDSRLKSIYFPGGHVDFITISRDDMPSKALSKIKVFDNSNNVIKEIDFVYSYFVGSDYDILSIVNPILHDQIPENYRYKRLKLDQVRIIASGHDPIVYKFDYNLLEKMPSKFSFSQDHYGFYNGIDNSRLYGFIPTMDNFYQGGDRRVKADAAKVFSLKSIIYPEKGKTELFYEGNTSGITNVPSNLLANYQDDNFIEKDAAISISSYSHSTSYPQPDEVINGIRYYRKRFSVGGAGYSDFKKNWSIVTNFGLAATSSNLPFFANNVEFKLERINADNTRSIVRRFNTTESSYSGSGSPARNGQDETMIQILTGEYEMTVAITFLAQPNTPADNQSYNLSFFVKWRELNADTRAVNVGGLRIKNINYYGHDNHLLKKKAYAYKNSNIIPSNPDYSSGQIVSFPLYNQMKIRQIGSDVSQSGRNEWSTIAYYSSSSILPLETTAGAYSGYEFVDEFDVDIDNPTNTLRTNSHFSFDRPYFSQYENNKLKGLIEPNEWNRGKLLERKLFKNNLPIKTEQFEYNYMSPHLSSEDEEEYVEEINTDLISFQVLNLYCLCFLDYPEDFFDTDGGFDNCVYYYYSPFDNYEITFAGHVIHNLNGIATSSCNNRSTVPYFKQKTGFDRLKNKITTTFDESNNPIIVREDYSYDNTLLHQQLTKTVITGSNGNLIEIENKFPQDIILSGQEETARQSLIAKHQLSTKLKEIRRVNGQEEVSQVNFLLNTTTNQVNPKALQKNSGLNGAFESLSDYTRFDETGNILEYKIVDGIKTSYLYAYNNQYPIAEIKNADYATVEGLIGGSAAVSNLSNSIPTDAQVQIIGNTLRNAPALKNAQITTYTYKPLVGMTSQTDPKGMTTYYEYDDFGRLKWIKDQSGNIVKENQYHYKN